MCIQALFSEFAYPACESVHEIKAVQVTRRQKSVAFGQSTAISLKHMNDSNESYVAVLVLGCIWHETICTKIYILLVQRVLVQLSEESSFLFLKYSLVFSLRLQFAWCCQYLRFSCGLYYTGKTVSVCLQYYR